MVSKSGTDREMTLAYVDILDYCKALEAAESSLFVGTQRPKNNTTENYILGFLGRCC